MGRGWKSFIAIFSPNCGVDCSNRLWWWFITPKKVVFIIRWLSYFAPFPRNFQFVFRPAYSFTHNPTFTIFYSLLPPSTRLQFDEPFWFSRNFSECINFCNYAVTRSAHCSNPEARIRKKGQPNSEAGKSLLLKKASRRAPHDIAPYICFVNFSQNWFVRTTVLPSQYSRVSNIRLAWN